MELHKFIELGIKTTGSGAELSRRLDMLYNNLQEAKYKKRGLPSHACVKLAELIDADPLEVIAASEMVTEKKPERQALWRRVLEHRHTTAMTLCFALVAGFMTPQNAEAFNNNNLSNALNTYSLYYVKLQKIVLLIGYPL
ncbi:MAG: hypothetical protein LBE32_07110 [Burkholderiales bacterium]|jgi:hypothetical protein|nr:hypothetical protein [Burkholderiales bacterium]